MKPSSTRVARYGPGMRGILLINLGTPASPSTADVRRYLADFLSDPRVLTMPAPLRWLLLHGFILRTRPSKSAAAYTKIWTERGSPLRFHSEDLAAALQASLGPDYRVVFGFQTGQPSIGRALDQLIAALVDEVVVLPLYPQYASSTTGSAVAEYERQAKMRTFEVPSTVLTGFCQDPDFVDACAQGIAADRSRGAAVHLVLSFHGLPVSHVRRADGPRRCLTSGDCCDAFEPENATCYRAQCFATARAIATRLGLHPEDYTVAFQSRLGRGEWIGPYTQDILDGLVRKGVVTVRVACPSFVADCLETLEEIAIGCRERFIARGGEELYTVPALNTEPAWVNAVAQQVRRATT